MRCLYSLRSALTLAAFLAFTACRGSAPPAASRQEGAPRAGTAHDVSATAEFTVDTATLDLPIEAPAQLYVEHDAVVVARSAGTIDSLFAELGDRVAAGQPLARLESAQQEMALAAAQVAYDNLVQTAARAGALVKTSGMTIADSEQIGSQLRQAEIARRKARYDLELTRINAPFDGLIASRVARPHRFVGVGDTLFRVTEETPLLARVRVPESSARSLRVGEPATLIAPGAATAEGRVIRTSPTIDAASGTREAVVQITGLHRSLVPGAAVVVRLGHERSHFVFAPRAAIAPDDFALVVDNGRSAVRSVMVGRDLGGGRVEVLSGLSLGERLARPLR